MSNDQRRNRNSIRMKPTTVCGFVIMQYVVDDLESNELQDHFKAAWRREDYEYMQALHAEATLRNIRLQLPEDDNH